MTIVPGAAKAPPAEAFVVGVGDRAGAEEFIAKIAPTEGEPAAEQQGELPLDVYPDGFATAFVERPARIRRRGRRQGGARRLGRHGPRARRRTGGRCDRRAQRGRFAEVFLSPAGVDEFLAGRAGPAAQLETFVDYEATSGLAAAVIAKEEGLEVQLVSELDPKLAEQNPSFFSSPAGVRARPRIGGRRGRDRLRRGRRDRPDDHRTARPGRARRPGARRRAPGPREGPAESDADVNPLQELLPALGGQAALVAEPGDARPFASLIVDGVDEAKANEALARLQAPVLSRSGPAGRVARSRSSARTRSTASPCARSRCRRR